MGGINKGRARTYFSVFLLIFCLLLKRFNIEYANKEAKDIYFTYIDSFKCLVQTVFPHSQDYIRGGAQINVARTPIFLFLCSFFAFF